jgi:tRNA(fMet)-specific endonuclease VapC
LTRFLLDTNIISDLIRSPRGIVASKIRDIGEADVCTSIIVAAELRYGAAKRGSARLTATVETILQPIEVLPFEAPADRVYGQLRADLQRAGKSLSYNDMLIAAHALTLGTTLVTDNHREFALVDGLPLANWLRPA